MVIKADCPCTKEGCPRHGNCDECRAHHNQPGKKPVFCERKKSLLDKLLRR